MSYEQILIEDIRRKALEVLQQDIDYSQNEGILQQALALIGHDISADSLRTHLAWLAEQGLVRVEDVAGVYVVELTRRGEDVALGRIGAPGVARKRPGM